ncbi:AsmA family protein [Spirosoma areae]
MNVPLKRWVNLLLIVVSIPLLAAGALYYVLINNLEDILTYAIEKETNGSYAFRSKTINLSIWAKAITIDSLTLTRKATASVASYYDVSIPNVYLSIDSWRELLINKRLAADSVSILKPEIKVHDYRVHRQSHRQTSFHTSSILENLQKTVDHLHAKSFTIRGGSFALFKRSAAAPFIVKDINLTVRNFSKIDNDDRRVFGSDNIELALGQQHWVLSDGKNTLSFRGMRFTSATQLVEIDSIQFRKPATAEKGEMSLRAEKFFFNSTHLPAVYQKGELWLDTLICIRPVLTMPILSKKTQVKDTTGTINANIRTLFKTVNVRYTEIKDGEILLATKASPAPTGGTRKANLTIHNLTFQPQKRHPLRIGGINLSLKNIAFFSPDSLFKISVESFTLLNKDVIFRHVLYGPASRKIKGKGLTFTAPLLRLHNISLDDLMQKRLVASDARLVQPSIVILATKKVTPKPFIVKTAPPKKVDLFKTLHGLGELLQVGNFQIIDASAQYTLAGDKPMNVGMKNMNATVLLNDFLDSDSLINMKHAIPKLTVGQVNLVTNKLNVLLTNYTLDGKKRHNRAEKLHINLPNGTSINANKLYWEAFAWDALQQSKDIQIEILRVQDVAIDVKVPAKKARMLAQTGLRDSAQADNPPPLLHIGQLLAGRVHLKATLPKQMLAGFQGTDIRVDKLTTEASHVGWEQISGKLNDLYLNQPGGNRLSVASVALNSQQTTTLTNLRYTSNHSGSTMRVVLPQLRMKGPFNSTDFSAIQLQSLAMDRPELTMVAQGNANALKPAKAFTIPLTFALQELQINRAKVNYITKKGNDSTQVQTVVDVEGKSVQGTKHEALTFASLRVNPGNVNLASPSLQTSLSAATVQLTNGKLSATKAGKPTFAAYLQASLTASDLHPLLKSRKNATPPELSVKRLKGSIDLPGFRWTAGVKIPWTTWVNQANLSFTDLYFKGKSTAITAENVNWTHKGARLQITNFQVTPTLSKAEFMTPPHLQADYITVQGDEAQLNGVDMGQWQRDSSIAISHVVVKNIMTNVSRDKRLPDPDFLPDKLMPTRLMSRIKLPFQIDSISVVNSTVVYHETSKVTKRVGSVPLRGINGVLTNITNRPKKVTDSLVLRASTNLLGMNIQRLHYRESYGDSLAGFHMLLRTSEVNLPELTQITNPILAATIDGGYVKPILARIAGNKYASVGNMHFHYNGLKVRLLNHVDTTRKSLLLKFGNFIIGKVLRKKNEADSRIFYDRDQKTFIFGYWIKTLMSGVLTSVGVKGNKRYHDNYLKLSQQHTLPIEE